MRLGVIGSRSFKNYDAMVECLSIFDNITEIVSGGARGADSIAERYAETHAIPLTIYEADWFTYGKSAGVIRNKKIVDGSDVVVAFWDGESKGTKYTIDLCRKNRVPCHVVFTGINK